MPYFFDAHCHLMTFDEPDFIMFLKQIGGNISKEAFNSMLSPDYLLDFRNKKLPLKVGNLINVMSHSQSQIAEIIERDLQGQYLAANEKAFATTERFTFSAHSFDKYVICPMVMDFTSAQALEDIYYNTRSSKDAFWHADKMLASIDLFYQNKPATLLEILPFAGINPPAYTIDEIERWLHSYFNNYDPQEHYQNKERAHFFGIKFYPPLGFNPWPDDKDERAKAEVIYSYAEKHHIPVTTHCDDEGYRTTDIEISHHHTNPETWRHVLEKYPLLKLNFAHFGRQYQRTHFMRKQEAWRNTIIDLALTYDNVYADFSFNGVAVDYYSDLSNRLTQLKKGEQRRLKERLMFGSDFMINLTKVSSYHQYLKNFEEADLPIDDKLAYAGDNCRRFLFEKVH